MLEVITLTYFLYICVELHLYRSNSIASKAITNIRACNKGSYKFRVLARSCIFTLVAITLEESLLQALLLFTIVVDLYIYLKQDQIRMKG